MMKKFYLIAGFVSVSLTFSLSSPVFGAEHFNPNAPSSYTCRQFIEDADGFGIGTERIVTWTHGYITGKFGAENVFPFEPDAIQRIFTHVAKTCQKSPKRSYVNMIDTMFDSEDGPSAIA